MLGTYLFFFEPKTAYEMRISDWSSDVCSSDLETVVVVEHDLVAGLQDRFAQPLAIDQAALVAERLQHHHAALQADARMPWRECRIVDADVGVEIGRGSWRERVCQ